MNPFTVSLRNELFKLRRHKKYTVFLILTVLICAVSGLRPLVISVVADGISVSRSALLAELTLSTLPFFLLIAVPFIALMAAGDLIAAEWADKSIRASLVRPASRPALYFSKAAAVLILCAVELAAVFLVTAVVQLVLGGTAKGLLLGLAACVLDLVPLAVLVLFFCMISQAAPGPGLSVLLCLAIYLGLAAAGTYIASLGGLLFTGYLRWHNLWLGSTLPFLPLLTRIGILVGSGLIFSAAGCMLFEKKDI